jgi:transcriptional regulator with XRE-family HTH domain
MSETPTFETEVPPGFQVRAFRDAHKLSLDDLADRIREHGHDRPSIAKLSRIETGQPVPTDLVPALQAITGIPAERLRPDLAKIFAKDSVA